MATPVASRQVVRARARGAGLEVVVDGRLRVTIFLRIGFTACPVRFQAGRGFLMFREGMKSILSSSPLIVVAEAASMQDLEPLVSASAPDLVLLDLAGEAEVAALRHLREQMPQTRLVILTSELSTKRLATALETGIDGYLLSDLSPEALTQSLKLVLLGEKVFPTSLAALLIHGPIDTVVDIPGGRRGLSERENQILHALLKGESNKMIANRLGITEATVKVHLKTVLRKIGVANRTQAAIWALNNGYDQSASSRAVGA
jgi:two-component system nitrate/nitrite response regulator NarL